MEKVGVMVSPREVLRLQADIVDRTANPDGFLVNFINGYVSDQWDIPSDQVTFNYGAAVHNHIKLGRAYHVEPDMIDLVLNHAEHKLSGTGTVADTPPPSPLGWCMFGKPLWTKEIHSRWQATVAISWGPIRVRYEGDSEGVRRGDYTATTIVSWSHQGIAEDEIDKWFRALNGDTPSQRATYDEAVRSLGGWAITDIALVVAGQRVGPAFILPSDKNYEHAERFGSTVLESGTYNTIRVGCAIWDLMGQTLSSHREEQLDRFTRKTAQRARINPGVTVITLRREAKQVQFPGTGTPLQFRTPVAGHYRNQPCGPGRTQTRRIWIADHERGPEGAPYRQTEKVYNLAR